MKTITFEEIKERAKKESSSGIDQNFFEAGAIWALKESEQLRISGVGQRSELVCDKPSPVKCPKWQRFENGCLDCNMVREQTSG